MNRTECGAYEGKIRGVLGCSAQDACMVGRIMRDEVLHTAALDWLSAEQFSRAARKAMKLLESNRADYEEYFANARAMFEQMRAAKAQEA